MSSIYEEVKNMSYVPLTMDLEVMEKKYYKADVDPIESNATMLREQMPDKNSRCDDTEVFSKSEVLFLKHFCDLCQPS